MLLSGALEIKDIDGNVVSGVSGNYFNKLSFTLTIYDSKFEPPVTIRGKKGYLVLKTTITTGINFKTSRSRVYLLNKEGNWFNCTVESKYHAKGTIHNYKYDIASISEFYQYKEYHSGSAGQSSGTYNHNLHGKVEGILYY